MILCIQMKKSVQRETPLSYGPVKDWMIRKFFYFQSTKQQKPDIRLPILHMECPLNLTP